MEKFQRVVQKTAKDGAVKAVVSEQRIMGGDQSNIITLEVTNGAAAPVNLVLGTPAGVPAEQPNFPAIVGTIGAIANDALTAATTTDNQGVGATFITAMNTRFVRTPVFVESIEVVTVDDAQRSNRFTVVDIPYNSATDSRLIASKFNAVDTEFTGILGSRGALLGEFKGLSYVLNVGILVEINIKLGAIDSPAFVACGY